MIHSYSCILGFWHHVGTRSSDPALSPSPPMNLEEPDLCDNTVTPYTLQHSRWWPHVPSKQWQHE